MKHKTIYEIIDQFGFTRYQTKYKGCLYKYLDHFRLNNSLKNHKIVIHEIVEKESFDNINEFIKHSYYHEYNKIEDEHEHKIKEIDSKYEYKLYTFEDESEIGQLFHNQNEEQLGEKNETICVRK